MKAMLLAAGEGTRFRPQTLKVPKPALPFLNVPLGYYFFPFLKSVGVDTLVVNTFHLPKLIEKLYIEQTHFKVQFSHETGKILGSGGGLGKARSHFSSEENFLLLNADEVLIPHNPLFLQDMKAQHLRNKPISTLLVMRHPGVGSKFGGIWVDSKKHIVGYGKVKPENAVEGFHYPGVQILNKDIFNYIPDGVEQNILYDSLTAAQKDGHKVELFETSGHWYETGSLSDYLAATKDVLTNIAKGTVDFHLLQKFLSEMSPDSQLETINDALVWKDASSKVTNSHFKDFAVVGKNVIVKNSKVEAAALGASTSFDSTNISKDLVLY